MSNMMWREYVDNFLPFLLFILLFHCGQWVIYTIC